MRFAGLVDRIGGESVGAWSVHYQGLARAAAGEDIIVLSVGQETSEVTPAPVVEAAVGSMRSGRHHYTDVRGELALREAIAERHRRTTGQPAGVERVSVFAGAQNCLFAVSQCLLETNDEVIVLEPYYTTYPATFSTGGARLVSVLTAARDDFQPDVALIEAAITDRTRAIVVNSPNNPTGAVYARDTMQAIVDLCVARDLWLISDEVYAALAMPGQCTSPGGLPGGDGVCVTIGSLSKSHRMTGWRIGWIVAPVELSEHLYDLAMCMCYGLPMFTQDAAACALGEADDLANEIRDNLRARGELMRDELGNLAGARIFSAGGGMFVVLDISALDVSGEQFAQGFLDQHGVSVLPCRGFGANCGHLLRISLCESPERLREACIRLRDYVAAEGWRAAEFVERARR